LTGTRHAHCTRNLDQLSHQLTIMMLTTRTQAFAPSALANRRTCVVVRAVARPPRRVAPPQPANNEQEVSQASLLAAGALLTPFLADVHSSQAAGGEFGLLEGRCAHRQCG
jgi:hypothetical protein